MIAISTKHEAVRSIARAMGVLMLASASLACARDEQPASDTPPVGDQPAASAPDTLPVSQSVGDPYTVSAYGYGPVRIGMTVDEARAALGGRLSVPNPVEGSTCAFVRSEGTPEGVMFMVVEGKVQRVDVIRTAAVATDAGAHIGEKEARVKELYPGLTVQPHKYTDGRYLIVAPDSATRLVFETNADTVTMMRGGLLPMVLWVEGCS
jgi:hypothetical protein